MGIAEIKKILDDLNIPSDVAKDTSGEVFILIQLVEQLGKENEELKTENQKLRDTINLLKGEQGKPIFPGKTKGNQANVSSEKEREKRKPRKKRKSKAKKNKIKIDRSEICRVAKSQLPKDAVFKGYEPVIVQEIVIATDNVEYLREKYYSPSQKKTYLVFWKYVRTKDRRVSEEFWYIHFTINNIKNPYKR